MQVRPMVQRAHLLSVRRAGWVPWSTPDVLAKVPVAGSCWSGTDSATKNEQVIDENHQLIHATCRSLAVVPEFDERNRDRFVPYNVDDIVTLLSRMLGLKRSQPHVFVFPCAVDAVRNLVRRAHICACARTCQRIDTVWHSGHPWPHSQRHVCRVVKFEPGQTNEIAQRSQSKNYHREMRPQVMGDARTRSGQYSVDPPMSKEARI